MYKEAAKQKLRFMTSKGPLSTEQLFDLSLTELDTLAVAFEVAYNESKGKSFLVKKTVKDKKIKLQFDILRDVLETKVAESEVLRTAKDDKAHNDKIINLIAEAEDNELRGKSKAELLKMLKK